MAGRGSRFAAVADQNPEYKKPKPLINVKGKPMVWWALKSLPFVELPDRPATTENRVTDKDLIFICLRQHEEEHNVTEVLKKTFGTNINIILIPEVTRGATETVLKAKDFINNDEELIVSDSDHHFDGTELYKTIKNKTEDISGIIPVFVPADKDPKWSYALTDKDLNVLAVGEKDAELAAKGAYANIGGYYFSKGKIFVEEAEAMIKNNDVYGAPGKQEFYVAPMYQRLLDKGLKIKVAVIPKVWGLGTPKDLEDFLANYKPSTSSG